MDWRTFFLPPPLGSSMDAVVVETGEVGNTKDPLTDNLPGTLEACLQLLRSSIDVLTHLGTLDRIGVPPSAVGALWSWPQAFRSFRSVVESANNVAADMLIIRTLASTEIADSAYRSATAISTLMQASKATGQQPRAFVPQELMASTVEALVEFRTVVRSAFSGELAEAQEALEAG